MTALERRGKGIFLILAGLLIGERLLEVGLALSGGLGEVKWFKSVVRPLLFAVGVACLWEGENWLRWLMGTVCIFVGGVKLFVSGRLLFLVTEVTPPEATGFFLTAVGYPVGILGLIGLLELVAGLCFLVMPSVRAFFRYQRAQRSAGPVEST